MNKILRFARNNRAPVVGTVSDQPRSETGGARVSRHALSNVIFSLLQFAASTSQRNGCVHGALRCCCAHSYMVFCNSLLPLRSKLAASILLCVAAAHVVRLSFASRCCHFAVGWLHQSCDDEFSTSFLVFGSQGTF